MKAGDIAGAVDGFIEGVEEGLSKCTDEEKCAAWAHVICGVAKEAGDAAASEALLPEVAGAFEAIEKSAASEEEKQALKFSLVDELDKAADSLEPGSDTLLGRTFPSVVKKLSPSQFAGMRTGASAVSAVDVANRLVRHAGPGLAALGAGGGLIYGALRRKKEDEKRKDYLRSALTGAVAGVGIPALALGGYGAYKTWKNLGKMRG